MFRSSFALAAAVAALTLSASAYAADGGTDSGTPKDKWMGMSGWYLSGSAGLSFLQEQDNHSPSGNVNFDTSGANPGFDITGALGKELGDGFRAEGELGYRQIEMGHATVYAAGGNGIHSGYATGNSHAFSVMGNGYYDFKQLGGPFVPYVGAGIGFANVSMDGVGVNGVSTVDDNSVVFAYQAMAGVGYKLTPESTIFTGYRYFAADDPTFTDSAGNKLHSEFATHNLEIGYRLDF